MRYLRPELQTFSNMYIAAESQYVVGIIPDPGDGCPNILFDKATGTGVLNVVSQMAFTVDFSSGGSCQGTASTSGTAVFVNNELQIDCSSSELGCNYTCNNTSLPTGGEICLTSLTVNGEPQDVTGICLVLNSTEIQFFISEGPCD